MAEVVEHWQHVFRITHLALGSLSSPFRKKGSKRAYVDAPKNTASLINQADPETGVAPPGTLPSRLVRIPVASNQNEDTRQDEADPEELRQETA